MIWAFLLFLVGTAMSAEPKDAVSRHATYIIDPAAGDDANPPGKPWKTFARLNELTLTPGDRVEIHPGIHPFSLKPSGSGTQDAPVLVHFLPGVHVIAAERAIQEPMFVSNSCDSPAPKPIAILVRGMKHVRFEGSESGPKPVIVAGGRMVQVWNDHSEDISYNHLAFDLKRTAVSEFRVEETSGPTAVISVAEGSEYEIRNGRFRWSGDWAPGSLCQEAVPAEGVCWRRPPPRGWKAGGQAEAKAIDLGGGKVKLEFPGGTTGLVQRHQYQFRSGHRDRIGVHNSRSSCITFQDCSVYALSGMGFVSQFTDTITYKRVDVAPPPGTVRTCPAWADVFQFSNCRGRVLVEDCRISGMQDDAINCHGTHLRIMDAPSERQIRVRFMQGQTYGFAPFVPGDEVTVINSDDLREYEGNTRRHVAKAEKENDKEWLLTLDGTVPHWTANDAVDNVSWYPELIARNNRVTMDPVRGFLVTTREKTLIEGNVFQCRMPGVLVEDDASGWFESGPVRDLTIRGNDFLGCGVQISPHAKRLVPEKPVHQNIRIIGNRFEGGGIKAEGVANLVISGNSSYPKALPLNIQPTCSGVIVETNTIATVPFNQQSKP